MNKAGSRVRRSQDIGRDDQVGIVGGTGYTGVELLRLLAQHPQLRARGDHLAPGSGMPVADMFPNLRGAVELAFSDPAKAALIGLRPRLLRHAERRRMEQARALVDAGVRVIDLAADFRIRDVAVWESGTR